jgi:apolipoprotein D and lipocalin family protein
MMRVITLAAWLLAAATTPVVAQPLQPVPALDLPRYAGTWHEIARYPNWFQRHCVEDVTATYTVRDDGLVGVLNACRKADGETIRAAGVARRPDAARAPAKLEVRFAPDWLAWLPLVWADYWVVELAPDYSYALVGEPMREYLWILARSPRLDDATYARLLERATALGYDRSRLVRSAARAPG